VTPLDIGGLRREFPDRRIDYYASIDSTMRVAAALEPREVVLAEEQTAGMGRHGHTWHSEAGSGIYCSLVVKPAPVLTLALGWRCRMRSPNQPASPAICAGPTT